MNETGTPKRMADLLKLLAAAAVLAALAMAGRSDFNEEVYSEMGYDTCQRINRQLGGDATLTEIVDEYLANREQWKPQQ